MERLIGWFWKGSSNTDDSKDVLSQANTEKVQEPESDQVQADKTNNAQTSVTDSIKPVLYDKSGQLWNERLTLWLQKNTYLQPEDCLTCKLSLTLCATLFSLTGLSVYKLMFKRREIFYIKRDQAHQLQRFRTRERVAYASIFAIWGVVMYGEWFNAIFHPPGEKPRSFFQREVKRREMFREAVQKYKQGQNADEEDSG